MKLMAVFLFFVMLISYCHLERPSFPVWGQTGRLLKCYVIFIWRISVVFHFGGTFWSC